MRQQHPEDFSLKGHLGACAGAAKLNLAAVKAELRDLKSELVQVDKTLQQQAEGAAEGGTDSEQVDFKVRLLLSGYGTHLVVTDPRRGYRA